MENPRIGKISKQATRVVIAVNPRAGSMASDSAAQQLFDHLKVCGLDPTMDSDIRQVCDAANELQRSGSLRAVVAVGGDGTVSLLANRLTSEMPLAILPQGTENLLAKHLEMPFAPREVCRVIEEGWTARLDAGEANGKLFLVMASCGFDADVVRQLHEARRGNIRHWYYFKPLFNSILRYQYPSIRIQCDDEKEFQAKWAFVFNAPRYAMGLPIAEDADAMDNKLDLCAFRGGNLVNGLMYFFGVLSRQHRRWKDTVLKQATRVRLTASEEVPYQLDGDPGGILPMEIKVLPARLRLMVPESWASVRMAKDDENRCDDPIEGDPDSSQLSHRSET